MALDGRVLSQRWRMPMPGSGSNHMESILINLSFEFFDILSEFIFHSSEKSGRRFLLLLQCHGGRATVFVNGRPLLRQDHRPGNENNASVHRTGGDQSGESIVKNIMAL
jgi:hypothetical protein